MNLNLRSRTFRRISDNPSPSHSLQQINVESYEEDSEQCSKIGLGQVHDILLENSCL